METGRGSCGYTVAQVISVYAMGGRGGGLSRVCDTQSGECEEWRDALCCSLPGECTLHVHMLQPLMCIFSVHVPLPFEREAGGSVGYSMLLLTI